MASLLEKARIIVLSNAHGLLDKVIDMDNVGAVRQYVRDVEDARDEAREAKAVAQGNLTTTVQERDALKARVTELHDMIVFIVKDEDVNNDHLALPMQVRLQGIKSQLEIKEKLVDDAQNLASKMSEVESSLSAKYESMKARLGELEALEKAKSAQNSAAKSLDRAAGVLKDGPDGDIDDVASKIRKEYNISTARLDQAMEGVDGGVEKDIEIAKAQQALQALKLELKAEKESATAGSTTA